MKRLLTILCAACCVSGVRAADRLPDIIFTNKLATFTNLQGKAYLGVELVKANMDGLVWRKDDGLGQIAFTNLDSAFLNSLGIDAERIDMALKRAAKSAA